MKKAIILIVLILFVAAITVPAFGKGSCPCTLKLNQNQLDKVKQGPGFVAISLKPNQKTKVKAAFTDWNGTKIKVQWSHVNKKSKKVCLKLIKSEVKSIGN